MDKFTKITFAIAVAGAAICAATGGFRNGNQDNLTLDDQLYRVTAAEAEDYEEDLFCYGGCFKHLEKDHSFLAWADASDRYVATLYYVGDHWSDNKLMVVVAESTGDVVQVVMTPSEEYRANHPLDSNEASE